MANYVVTIRTKDGSLAERDYTANDRAELFKKLAADGVTAVRVSEGAAGKKPRKAVKKAGAPSKGRGLIAAAIVVLGAGLAVWWMMKGEEKVVEEKKGAKVKTIKTVKNIALPNYREVVTNDVDMIVLPNGVVTNKPKTIAEAVAMVRLKPGRHVYKSVDDVFARTNEFQIGKYKSENLKSSTETHLALIAGRRRDQLLPPMPPMPSVMASDFEAALKNYLQVEEGDTENDVKVKKKIEMMKEMMISYVDKGFTPAQAIHEIENEHNRSANLYHLYRDEYIKMVRSNTPDADAFYLRATQDLKKKGAPIFDENAQYIEED